MRAAGDVFWIREGSPDEWRIGVQGNEALDDASAYRFGLAEFLYRWLSNRLDVPAFPRDEVFDGKVPAIYRE